MSSTRRFPWQGDQPCSAPTNSGAPCRELEIEGLDFCFWHVPEDMLDEAEEITGLRRCRRGYGTPDACRQLAVGGTEPPQCKNHGANVGSYQSKLAAGRQVEERVTERLAEVLSERGEKLLNPPAVSDPLSELLELAAEVRAFKEILRELVAKMDLSTWRYTRDRIGEQVRAEIVLYERAIERYGTLLLNIAKLNIAGQLAKIEQQKVTAIERALDMALQASGADLAGQQAARKVLHRELKAVAS